MPLREKIAWVVLVVALVLYLRGSGVVPVPPVPPAPPAPIPVPGLHVLIVEEVQDRPKLPKEQVAIFTSTEVRTWLDANAKWRIYDDDSPMQHDEKVWQDAMKLPRQSLPWLIVSNGKTGYMGPLPKSSKEFLDLVQKYR